MNDPLRLETQERLLGHLRKEVAEVKDSFTKFTFQGLFIATLIVAFTVHKDQDIQTVGWASIPGIIMLMVVARIGIFTFTTANRNCGYELHLARMRRHRERAKRLDVCEKIEAIESVAWEEAMRAWRVVQVALFREIYKTPETAPLLRHIHGWIFCGVISYFLPWLYMYTKSTKDMIGVYKKNVRTRDSTENTRNLTDTGSQPLDSAEPYPWFSQELLTKIHQGGERAHASLYYTGNYLKHIFTVLLIVQLVLSVPLFLMIGGTAKPSVDQSVSAILALLHGAPLGGANYYALVFFGAVILAICLRHWRITRWRRILENELLSIHSCAIIWQYVIQMHLLALYDGERPYRQYTERLARNCQKTKDEVFVLPEILAKRLGLQEQ